MNMCNAKFREGTQRRATKLTLRNSANLSVTQR
jgi:hypothetical protein